jgi:hypothetical protein
MNSSDFDQFGMIIAYFKQNHGFVSGKCPGISPDAGVLMQVGQIVSRQTPKPAKIMNGQAPETGFSQILHSAGNAHLPENPLYAGGPSPSVGKLAPPRPGSLVFLGTVSSETPTVSDLLIQHPVFKKDPWSIIHADTNLGKPFTRMQPGTQVYLDPQTQELLWTSGDPKSNSLPADQAEKALGVKHLLRLAGSGPLPHSKGPILLGTISSETPTVSDLLIKHPDYKKDPWSIIHADTNLGKPFTRMPIGTQVYLDPETSELTWGGQLEKERNLKVASTIAGSEEATNSGPEGDRLSEALVKAVEPLLGSPYERLNCYEMVVVGLKNLGIRYEGRGGLAEKLIRTAAAKGLPNNAYFNGEGLVAVSGKQVYSKTLPKVMNLDRDVERLYQEMEPLLRRGFILSFSTPTRGHTGIVSRKDELWTYINSGNMDHSVMDGMVAKGVGEELLRDELKNWLRLAAERNEPLQITLGRIQEAKIQAYMA